MLDRILLPVDGTEIPAETLTYILQLGDPSVTEIHLLHVQADDTEHKSDDAGSHPLLAGYHDALKDGDWKVSAAIRHGDPVDEIIDYARQTEPTLLVMSTHGRSGLENIREGSVTEQVVRRSPSPVFILHSLRADLGDGQRQNLFHRMLVPLDGSEVSAAILPCVRKFALMHHSEVVLFHDHPDCEESAAASRRREFIGHHGVELANAGVSVKLDCSTHRHPVQEILQRTDDLDIDIVAMVTHGHDGERRPLEESVTANVMRHASRPLLVWSSDPHCQPGG